MEDCRAREVRSAKALRFVQKEHSRTLEDLHQEIQRLQMKCADLNFKLIMASAKPSEKREISGSSSHEEELERRLAEMSVESAKWRAQATQKDEQLTLLSHNFKEELHTVQKQLHERDKIIRSLHEELDQRADTVATLTNKLRSINVKKSQEVLEDEAAEDKVDSLVAATSPATSPIPQPRPPSTPRRLSSSSEWRHRRLQKSLSATALPNASSPPTPRARLMGTSERTVSFESRHSKAQNSGHSRSSHQTAQKPSSALERMTKPLKERSHTVHSFASSDLHLIQSLTSQEQVAVKPPPAVLPPIQPKTHDDKVPQMEQEQSSAEDKTTSHQRQAVAGKRSTTATCSILPQPLLRAAFAGPRITRQKRPAILAAHRQNGRQGARSAVELETTLSAPRDVCVEKIISKAAGKTVPPTQHQLASDSAGQ